MKRALLAAGFVLAAGLAAVVVTRGADNSRIVHLPTSKSLTLPVPGYIGRTNSFPATIAVSPDGRFAALLNQGYGTQETGARQSIAILDLSNNQLRDFPDDRLSDDESTRQSYFVGMAFSRDGKHLYASMGSITDPTGEKPRSTGNGIAVYKITDGDVTPERFIRIPPQQLAAGKEVPPALRKTTPGTAIPYPAGFAVLKGENGDRLLVANNLSDNVVLLDVASGKVVQTFDLSRNGYVPSAYPYTVVANEAGTKAWVSLWNASTVAELDLANTGVKMYEPLQGGNPLAPSAHPTAMALSSLEDTLYVALSNTDYDSVMAYDLRPGQVGTRLHATFKRQSESDQGAVPLSVAASADGKLIFAACASLDAVAVFDAQAKTPAPDPLGFIPTGWYPSALAVVGRDLLIVSAKGEGSGPNNMMGKLKSERRHREHPYIPTLIRGSIQRIHLSEIEGHLPEWTKQVEQDNLLYESGGQFAFAGSTNPIRHVIYVLKENRTYDQIFGDLPVGDGDPSLTMYGAEITPNEHKLALQFGVLDNFYDSGEVSGDGHIWSNAATTSDYNEKNWPIGYRSKERTYDADGTVAEEIAMEHGIPDIDDPGTGFIWDNLAKHGLSYRVYGEFIHPTWCKSEKAATPKDGTPSAASAACAVSEVKKGDLLPSNVGNPPGSASPWPWSIPQLKSARATKPALRDHFDPLFPDFNTDYPDQLRADEFLREFGEFVEARGTAKELPQFILLYLPDDHTGGTRPGHPTPQASVADNDLAVGRVVEAVSQSPYWDDTAIFVIEDDAQDGADHVDAHRSTALVISRYSPRGDHAFVDHTFYTTVSMVRTMEELLHLPPMNLFDAHAPLMTPLFSGPGTQPPFRSDDKNLRSGLIYKVNEKKAAGAKESSAMDFSRPDAAAAGKLNQILWRDAKGDTAMPRSSQ